MPHRILVPLDGSDLADVVLPWVDALSAALQAEVELLHVMQRDLAAEALQSEIGLSNRLAGGSPTDEGLASMSAIQSEAEEQEARLALATARGKLQRDRDVELTVLPGLVPETIVAHAYRSGATLIAMASRARTGLVRTVLGSVTGAVIHDSPVPVLVVRYDLGRPAHAPQRILVPLDMSDLAEAALRASAPLARELHGQIVLFHAVGLPPQTFPLQGAAIPLGLPPAHAPAEVMGYLERVGNEMKAEGSEVGVRLGSGSPAEAIALGAEQSGAGLIAMSTHGRSGVGRWLLGSVAESVIGRASVPVLVVRPPQLPLSPAAALSFEQGSQSEQHAMTLTLTPRQAQVVRLGLEHLAWTATRHESALADIRDALAALDTAKPVEGEGHA